MKKMEVAGTPVSSRWPIMAAAVCCTMLLGLLVVHGALFARYAAPSPMTHESEHNEYNRPAAHYHNMMLLACWPPCSPAAEEDGARSPMTAPGHRNGTHHVMEDGTHMAHGDHSDRTDGPALLRTGAPAIECPQVRDPTIGTIIRHDGPTRNHIGLCCDEILEHQMALITSDCVPFR